MTSIEWGIVNCGVELERLSALVARKIWPEKPSQLTFPFCGIAVVRKDELLAALIYHNYEPENGVVEISGAAWHKGWLTRPVLHAMYEVPFKHLECQAVVQRVSDDDTAQHRMLKSFGAEHYRIPRLRGRDQAENIFIVTEEAWRTNNLRRLARERKKYNG